MFGSSVERRGAREITDIPGLDTQLIKGNGYFLRMYSKMSHWTKGAGNPPQQLNYMMFGDSTGGLITYNVPGSGIMPFMGVMRSLARGVGILGGFNVNYTYTGTYFEADGTEGQEYDYSVFPSGIYRSLTNAATMRTTSATQSTEFSCYYIKEPDAGTATLELRTSTDAAVVSVNSVDATLNVDCSSESNSLGKAGFLYQLFDHTNASGGTFTFTFGGETTAAIAYNASAAAVQTALEALTSIGVGNVGVEKSGNVWSILIKSSAFGWQTLTWTTSGLTGYLTTSPYVSTAGFHLKLTSTSATIRVLPFVVVNRSRNGLVYYYMGRGGLHFDAYAQTWTTLRDLLLADIMPDVATWAHAYGQHGGIADQAAFFAGTQSAYGGTDWIVLSMPPHKDDTTDALVPIENAELRSVCDAAGLCFIDTYSAVGGWQGISPLGTEWTGDGVHLGNAHNAYCGSLVSRQIGLDGWYGLGTWRPLIQDEIGVIGTGGLEFRKSVSSPSSAFVLRADQTYGSDAELAITNGNRAFKVIGKYGTVAQFGEYEAVDSSLSSFVKNPLHLGTYNGPALYVRTSSPEGALAAKIGSLCLNTSGGAGTTLYVKESGDGTNTGWVGK